ncbi:conserved hypothetical protein, with coiled coil motives [Planktothrix serta PCC 8927]|uniref:Uncharacterized protein n=1 Tax=Planktothrix serta PCC 8927 TaxID=671068 RepID=A0A7Z9BLD2_9CYAN|nr:hypothetical protein [Planktothrix serta]VXD10606.1 conserved hypothetical protein, with coiled coil motives [Planktothrix serta PCC 8927]
MEFQSNQELEKQIGIDAREIVSEENRLESYQKDMEAVQASLTLVKSRPGLYLQSDSQLIKELEAAKAQSERNIETSRQKIREVIGRMKSKLNNLNQRINITEGRIDQMEQAVNSLIPRCAPSPFTVQSQLETQISQQKNEVEDAKDKANSMEDWIDNAGTFVDNVNGIFDFVGNGCDFLNGVADLFN